MSAVNKERRSVSRRTFWRQHFENCERSSLNQKRNRQNWINTLRDCIAEFQTKAKIALVEADLANHDQTSFVVNADNHDEAMRTMGLLFSVCFSSPLLQFFYFCLFFILFL